MWLQFILLGRKEGTVTLEGNAVKISTGSVQIPDPFAEYETLADAARAAGFALTVPDAANGSDRQVFQAIQNELLEVIYRRGGNETARIRKAFGTGDISGDYGRYRGKRNQARVVRAMRRLLCYGDSNTYGYDPRSCLAGATRSLSAGRHCWKRWAGRSAGEELSRNGNELLSAAHKKAPNKMLPVPFYDHCIVFFTPTR